MTRFENRGCGGPDGPGICSVQRLFPSPDCVPWPQVSAHSRPFFRVSGRPILRRSFLSGPHRRHFTFSRTVLPLDTAQLFLPVGRALRFVKWAIIEACGHPSKPVFPTAFLSFILPPSNTLRHASGRGLSASSHFPLPICPLGLPSRAAEPSFPRVPRRLWRRVLRDFPPVASPSPPPSTGPVPFANLLGEIAAFPLSRVASSRRPGTLSFLKFPPFLSLLGWTNSLQLLCPFFPLISG